QPCPDAPRPARGGREPLSGARRGMAGGGAGTRRRAKPWGSAVKRRGVAGTSEPRVRRPPTAMGSSPRGAAVVEVRRADERGGADAVGLAGKGPAEVLLFDLG